MKLFTDGANVFLFEDGILTHLLRQQRVVNYRFERVFKEDELLRMGYREINSGDIIG